MKKYFFNSALILFLFISLTQINSQVFQEWVKRYNGTYGANGNVDMPTCMTADNAGFIYVAGSSYQASTYRDMFTIKMTAAGDTVWTRKFNGASGGDYIFAIAVDNSGNVYVTGRADFGGTVLSDFLTIKYNSAGVLQWYAQYNGMSSGIDESDCIVVDNAGNVYISGKSPRSGTTGNLDIVTIKYNSSGVQQWVNTYNGTGSNTDQPYSIALAPTGDVIVGGASISTGAGLDAVVLNLNSTTGEQQWIYKYNKNGVNGADVVKSIAIDASGNIYAGGYTDNGTAAKYDYLTFKLNPAGELQWMSFYNGTGSAEDYGNAIALDASANVFITGKSLAADYDYATVKYNGSTGAVIWASIYNGAGNGYDEANCIKVDGYGNAFVAGGSVTAANDTNFATIKYNNAGVQQWVMSYNGPGNRIDIVRALVIDDANHVYITGESFGGISNYDFATIKYYACNFGVNAGNDTTIYYGYGSTATLTALAYGGKGPYSYLWSTNETTPTIVVSPDITTTYTVSVTDAGGCTGPVTDDVIVNVINVTCKNGKVFACHKGNTICIDSTSVPDHLGHGDVLGPCSAQSQVPSVTLLNANYPNPFNPVTSISFSLSVSSKAKLVVYDNIGREVAVLVDGFLEAGIYKYDWNASNFASGIYFYKLAANNFEQVKKMVLIK